MVAAQWNCSKKWHMFAAIIHTALFYTVLPTLFWTEFFQYSHAFKNWGGDVYLKRIYNKITKLCAIITVSTLQWDMRPNPSPNPISSVLQIYFVILIFLFLTKVSSWRMYANCVWVCLCLYMADCKYKVWVRQWCWWHLLSTDKHHI